MEHSARWAVPPTRATETVPRRLSRPYPLNRSYADVSVEDDSLPHDDLGKKHTEELLSSLREQFSTQLKSQSDEARNCYKMLSDQLVALDSRLRAQEKEGTHSLDVYKSQAELEGRIIKQSQEVKTLLKEFARVEDVKSLEDGLKRSNSLKLQTLEYRLQELSDSNIELQSVLRQLLQKDKSTLPRAEDLTEKVFTASVQRIDKLLERELIPLINEQESRLAVAIDARLRTVNDSSRSALRTETELKQRINSMEESFRELLQETSSLRSQAQGVELRGSSESQLSQLRDEVRSLERSLSHGLTQLRTEFQAQLRSELLALPKTDSQQVRNDVANQLKLELPVQLKADMQSIWKPELQSLSNRVDADLRTHGAKVKEFENHLSRLAESLETRLQSLSQQVAERPKRDDSATLVQSLATEVKANISLLQKSLNQLQDDMTLANQRLASVESRLVKVEESQYSARESPDALNQSIVIDKSSLSINDKDTPELATFGEAETVGKVVTRAKGMKGGIRGIQQLHLNEEGSDESRQSPAATPNLTAEQITSSLFDALLGQEVEVCAALLRGGELVLSSLDSYREVGRGASPLLSWDPDDEQDDGANLSDRRVDLRAMRRLG